MQPLPAPPRLAGRRPAAALFVAAVIAAGVAVTLAVWGQGWHDQPVAQQPAVAYNGLIGGAPLQSARCVQWNGGTGAERDRVAAALAHSVGGATQYGRGTTLSSGQAHTLFDNACASPIAKHWLLYELYIRAAGFRSYMPR